MTRAEDESGGERLQGRNRAALWRLWRVRGIQYHHLRRLERRLDGAFAAFWQEEPEGAERLLAECEFGEETATEVLEEFESGVDPLEEYRAEGERLPEGARIVHLRDSEYPARLYELEGPPVFVYVYGELEACRRPASIAVVGSREASVRDVRRARRIVGPLVEAGLSVVSGGALGIDRAAHEAALDAGGETVVLLPAGLDNPTPKSNLDVFERAVEQGAIVTEYPVDVELRRYHFPRRNRLIAALGDATFVVRAGAESGTMLTADAAREIGRPICALPGDLDEPLAEGCLDLIVDGADAVRSAGDILEAYYPDSVGEEDDGSRGGAVGTAGSPGDSATVDLEGLSGDGRELAEAIRETDRPGDGPWHADRLGALMEWSAGRLQTALLELELHGICEKAGGAQAYRFVGL